MGIEPAGKAVPNLGNRQFCAMADAKCDWRVNFHGMWGNVRLRRDTSTCEIPDSSLLVVGLRSAGSGPSTKNSPNEKGMGQPIADRPLERH